VIDIVADDLDALLRQIDGRTVTGAFGERELQIAGATVDRMPMNLGEQFIHVISNPNIAYILLSLGTLLLLAELAEPGLGLAGAGSVICFVIAFMALGSLPVNWAGIALLALGVALLVVGLLTDTEVVLGIGGLAAFVLGSLLLRQRRLCASTRGSSEGWPPSSRHSHSSCWPPSCGRVACHRNPAPSAWWGWRGSL